MSTHQIALLGLPVQLDRAGDRKRPCHGNRAFIAEGVAMYPYGLRCATCQKHRGWLSKPEAEFLLECITQFGPPEKPFTIRNIPNSHRGKRANTDGNAGLT